MIDTTLHEAIMFAAKAHQGQFRKGTGYPYIIHPMEVLQILTAMDMPLEVLVAGVLHDTVEDTEVTIGEIREKFGDAVAALVDGHTEDKSKSWQERKSAGIQEMKEASEQLKAVILADKLSNMRSLEQDYREQGEALWDRFNAPKSMQSWYYTQLFNTLDQEYVFSKARPFVEEFKELYTLLFVQEMQKEKGTSMAHICPVCGTSFFSKKNSHEICGICQWEDDKLQEEDPTYEGGANFYCLAEYRDRFQKGLSTE